MRERASSITTLRRLTFLKIPPYRDESVHFPLKCIISLQGQTQRTVLNVKDDERMSANS